MRLVQWSGAVTDAPTFVRGSRTHSMHEQFDVRRDDGLVFRVVLNIDIAPRVPVQPGDRITVRGEAVGTARRPIVHWTHHDPHGSHPDGWIEHAGRRYELPAIRTAVVLGS
jgi:hypothetical protein